MIKFVGEDGKKKLKFSNMVDMFLQITIPGTKMAGYGVGQVEFILYGITF